MTERQEKGKYAGGKRVEPELSSMIYLVKCIQIRFPTLTHTHELLCTETAMLVSIFDANQCHDRRINA